MSKPVILTGLRANSEFHIGNYIGAILPMVEMQAKHAGEYQINMFLPDLHSFTTPIDHGKLQRQILDNIKLFAAAGIALDNPDVFLYRQSYVPAHSELTWILDCFTYFGEASRMIEFKDKSAKFGNDTVSVGQFNYPILMSADVLLYGAQYVPLGDDQRQHLELMRVIAERMNSKFGELFVVPETWAKQLAFTNRESIRIRSLRHPDKKMSKSVDDPSGTIMMSDDPAAAAKKVMGAETDSVGVIHLDWVNQIGISNLLQLAASLTGKPLKEVAAEWEGKTSYGDLKQFVADTVSSFLSGVQSRLANLDDATIVAKLEHDEKAMNDIANATLYKVQKAVGLRP